MIIGLTGLPASGKATIANYLVKKHNYKQLLFSDIIKSELAKSNIINPVREDYKNKALELRQKYGDGALALLLIQQCKKDDANLTNNYVLDGIRTMGEVIEIKKVGSLPAYAGKPAKAVQIWAVTAPIEKRLEWIKSRNRNIDTTLTTEDLKQLDEKELYSGEQTQGDHTLAQTIKNADKTLINDKEIEDLEEKVEGLI